jgi:shikimate 5-dehydrogenase
MRVRDEGQASLSKRMRTYLDNVLRFERERGEAETVWRLSDKERAWVTSWLSWLDALEQQKTVSPALRLVQGGAQRAALPALSHDGAAIARLLADAARAIRNRDVFDAGWFLGLAHRGAFALSDAGESARALGLVSALHNLARKTLRTCDRPAAERQLALFGRV